MATLSALEQQRLGTVRPELRAKLLELKDAAGSQLGFTLTVGEDGGFRTLERQQQLYNLALAAGDGTTPAYAVAPPGKSRHNYGAAFDVWIVAGGAADDGGGDDADYQALADLGKSLGLNPGYYFAARGVGKSDPYHFQLSETLEQSVTAWGNMARPNSATGIVLALIAIGAAVAIARTA